MDVLNLVGIPTGRVAVAGLTNLRWLNRSAHPFELYLYHFLSDVWAELYHVSISFGEEDLGLLRTFVPKRIWL